MTELSKFKVANAFKHLDPNEGLADGIAPSFPTLRYRGKNWSLHYAGTNYPFKRDDDGTALSYIDAIIVGISPGLSKAYFGDEQWTEESASGPICYSIKGDVPDPGVPDKQSDSCGICEHNEWITKPGGGRGKECQDHKRMAVLLMPAMTKKMLGSPLMEPVHLKIPPASLKSLKKYSDQLQSEGIPFASVVTRISFTQGKLFELAFTTIQALTDQEAPLVLPMRESSQTRAILGSMPEVKTIGPPAKPAEKVDTGLLSAFTGTDEPAPAPARRGRPRAVPQTIENGPQPAGQAKQAEVPPESEPGNIFEESDSDLDATVAKLMGDKMNKMLK